MTAQQTLRAALEKHGLSTHSIAMIGDGDVPPLRKAILEAMQQHRGEAIEEVEKWAKNKWKYRYGSATAYKSSVHSALSKFLAALKTSPGGSLT